jgi:hypothetical protein
MKQTTANKINKQSNEKEVTLFRVLGQELIHSLGRVINSAEILC